jgi:hypothetical protein
VVISDISRDMMEKRGFYPLITARSKAGRKQFFCMAFLTTGLQEGGNIK